MFLQHPAEAMRCLWTVSSQLLSPVSSCNEPLENPTTFAPWEVPPLRIHLWGELQPSAGGWTVLVPPAPPVLWAAQPASPAAPRDGLKDGLSVPGAALEAHQAPYEGALAF